MQFLIAENIFENCSILHFFHVVDAVFSEPFQILMILGLNK